MSDTTRVGVEAPIEESNGRQPFKALGEGKCSTRVVGVTLMA